MTKLTDRQLADLVAEHVMGWYKESAVQWWKQDGTLHKPCGMWKPCNDWNDASLIVKRMNSASLIFRLENGRENNFAAEFFDPYAGSPADDGSLTFVRAEAETAPKAICLAALKAKGVSLDVW